MNNPSLLARRFAPALLLALLVGAVQAQTPAGSDDLRDGIKRRGDGSVDDTQPGGPAAAGSLPAKLERLEFRRAKIEAQRERHLSDLAPDDPKRAEIDARYDKKQAQVDTKQERIEARIARGEDDGVEDGVRREDRRADRREDRQADRGERRDRTERPERANRAERAERPERPERPQRPERPERSGRG